MKTRKLRLRGSGWPFSKKTVEPTQQETGQLSNEERGKLANVKKELEILLTKNTKSIIISSTLYNSQQSNLTETINIIDESSTIDDFNVVKNNLKRFIFNNICDFMWRKQSYMYKTSEQSLQQNKIKELLQSLFSMKCNTPRDCAEIIFQQIMNVIPNLSSNTRDSIYTVLKQNGLETSENNIYDWLDTKCEYQKSNVFAQLFPNFGSSFDKEPDKSKVDGIIQFSKECYRRIHGTQCQGGGKRKRKTKRKTKTKTLKRKY